MKPISSQMELVQMETQPPGRLVSGKRRLGSQAGPVVSLPGLRLLGLLQLPSAGGQGLGLLQLPSTKGQGLGLLQLPSARGQGLGLLQLPSARGQG